MGGKCFDFHKGLRFVILKVNVSPIDEQAVTSVNRNKKQQIFTC